MRHFTLLLVMMIASVAHAADKVTIALNWVPEPEFGGIYEAKYLGEFAKRGLDVEIKPGGAGAPTWQLVATGKVDYAVASADEVLIARAQGAKITAIFATYQTCPQGIMTHASRRFKDLADIFKSDGKVAMEPGLAYVNFLKNKYGFDTIKAVSYDGGVASFLNDKNFSQQCFVFSEPIAAKRAGADPKVFLIAESGYNPYTAVIITQTERVQQKTEQVGAVTASLQAGWKSYLQDPKATNEMMGKLNPDMDQQTFAAASEAQKPLIESEHTREQGLGFMAEQRWKDLAQQLVDLKVLEKLPDVSDWVFVNIKLDR